MSAYVFSFTKWQILITLWCSVDDLQLNARQICDDVADVHFAAIPHKRQICFSKQTRSSMINYGLIFLFFSPFL